MYHIDSDRLWCLAVRRWASWVRDSFSSSCFTFPPLFPFGYRDAYILELNLNIMLSELFIRGVKNFIPLFSRYYHVLLEYIPARIILPHSDKYSQRRRRAVSHIVIYASSAVQDQVVFLPSGDN